MARPVSGVRSRARGPNRRSTSGVGGGAAISAGVRLAVLRRAGGRLPVALAAADGTTRAEIMGHLQRHVGNAGVQRLIGPAPYPVQRYRVGVPRTADCETVIQWLNTQSPYRPMWAKTNVRFSWTGTYKVTGTAPDFQVSIANPRVTVRKPVDMPQWRPRDPALAAAWTGMYGQLRAHEAEHEAIADRWRETLLERLAALSLPITASSRRAALAAARAALDAEWQGWLTEHQADQDAIDPYVAVLDCP